MPHMIDAHRWIANNLIWTIQFSAIAGTSHHHYHHHHPDNSISKPGKHCNIKPPYTYCTYKSHVRSSSDFFSEVYPFVVCEWENKNHTVRTIYRRLIAIVYMLFYKLKKTILNIFFHAAFCSGLRRTLLLGFFSTSRAIMFCSIFLSNCCSRALCYRFHLRTSFIVAINRRWCTYKRLWDQSR